MIFEVLDTVLGIIKLGIYKLLNYRRISFDKMPKINKAVKLCISKNGKVKLGKNCRLRRNVSLYAVDKGEIIIGSNVFMNENCMLSARNKITIHDNCMLGNNIYIYDNDHDYKHDLHQYITKEIEIGQNTWIGCNVVILKGVRIGSNCVIGAGSVIKESVPDNSLVFSTRNTETKAIRR